MTGTAANTHEGKVVGVNGDKLTTTCNEGKTHHHTMDKDAKVSCEGKACKASELKTGSQVKVTTHPDDKSVATHVESTKATPASTTAKKA